MDTPPLFSQPSHQTRLSIRQCGAAAEGPLVAGDSSNSQTHRWTWCRPAAPCAGRPVRGGPAPKILCGDKPYRTGRGKAPLLRSNLWKVLSHHPQFRGTPGSTRGIWLWAKNKVQGDPSGFGCLFHLPMGCTLFLSL